MRNTLLFVITALFPMLLNAQSFGDLWKQYEAAQKKDLPQTQLSVLKKIEMKAEKERVYPQFLKAVLTTVEVTESLAPDSIEGLRDRLIAKAEAFAEQDKVPAAILNLAIYKGARTLGIKDAQPYYDKAFKDKDLLAATKAESWKEIVDLKADSEAFGGDMLSLMGYEVNAKDLLIDYYKAHGNRRACALVLYNWRGSFRITEETVNEYLDVPEGALLAYHLIFNKQNCIDDETMALLRRYQANWSGTKYVSYLDNLERDFLNGKVYSNSFSGLLLPNKPCKIKLHDVQNVKNLKLTIVPLNVNGRDVPEQRGFTNESKYYADLLKRYAAKEGNGYKEQQVIEKTFDLEKPYAAYKDSIELPGLPVGVYYLKYETDKTADKGLELNRNVSTFYRENVLYVSGLRIIRLGLPCKKYRTVVVDAETGHEVKGATLLSRPGNKNVLCAYTKKDNAMPFLNVYSGELWVSQPEKEVKLLNLYTDRGIYRPGQTLRVAGIAHVTTDGRETKVLPNTDVKLVLRDANYKTVEEKTVKTDDFGTIAADFLLPKGSLTGLWSVYVEGYRCATPRIRVEEYKRPTFEVSFEDYDKDYKLGDTIRVKGTAKTYAGVPVANGKVVYSVQRERPWWFWWRNSSAVDAELLSDTVVTDDKGEFFVTMPLTPNEDENAEVSPYRYRPSAYSFTVNATVTNISGESHEGEYSLTASNTPFFLRISVKDKVLKGEDPKLAVTVRNSAGKEVKDAEVAIQIDGKPYVSIEEAKAAIANLPSGKHQITASTAGKLSAESSVLGDYVAESDSVFFTLFSLDDNKPVEETPMWFYATADKFDTPDDVVTLQFGSSCKDVDIFYDVFIDNEHKESTVLHCSNSLIRKDFRCIDAENTILVTMAWMKDGVLYKQSQRISHPMPKKDLKLAWKTFRNKLEPGQKEEWEVSVRKDGYKDVQNGMNRSVTMLAAMYDKSLDALYSCGWNTNLGLSAQQIYADWNMNRTPFLSISLNKTYKTLNTTLPEFSQFNVWPFTNNRLYGSIGGLDGIVLTSRAPMRIQGTGKQTYAAMKVMAAPTADLAESVVEEEAATVLYGTDNGAFKEAKLAGNVKVTGNAPAPSPDSQRSKANSLLSIRSDFSETAFFYPQLMADENGDVKIRFTLPESTTTWQFRALAHDKEMNFGMLEDEIVAQKQLMITPNMPRFLRQGDKAVLSSVVSNLSDNAINAKVSLVILNPENEAVVLEKTQDVTIEAGKTTAADFAFSTEELSSEATVLGDSIAESTSLPLYIIKVMAESDAHSDGEQHYLAVIESEEPVMTTRVITMIKPGKETVKTAELFPKDAKDKRITVEWTENPAYLLLETLPYLNAQDQTTAYSQAAAYYANALGSCLTHAEFLTNSTRVDEELRTSSLRTSDAKTLLLAETPWVLDAQGEEERMRMLRNFYDENTLSYNQEQILRKLQQTQTAEGGWSWCPQMPVSYHITSQICELFVRLNNMIGEQKATKSMLSKAMKCLHKQAHKEIQEMRRDEKKGIKPYINDGYALQYLYLKALSAAASNGSAVSVNGGSAVGLTAQERADADYLIKYLKQQERKNSLYMKAKLAIVLNFMGEKALAKEYIRSIKEYSVYKELEGRYFDTKRALYSWRDYKQPTQTMVIEALCAITPDDRQTISELQRWLLMQKRTQMWDTPINTVNNVYAFALNSQTSGLSDSQTPGFPDSWMSGSPNTRNSGYSKTTHRNSEIKPEYTFEKTDNNVSWGAVYAQYKQKAADVTDYSQGLAVQREVLVEGNKAKVVITITADRDYDFVQVVDKRAACLEPVNQLSRYCWSDYSPYYIAPQDSRTCYFFNMMRKGKHVIETEYYVDRQGDYNSGTCTVQCAYAPEFYGRTGGKMVKTPPQPSPQGEGVK